MRSSAKIALSLLLAVPFNCLLTGAFQANGVRTPIASVPETNKYTIVRFESRCSECEGTAHSSLPLELRIRKARAVCDGTGIYLNGDDLVDDLDGDCGRGSGSITALSGDFESAISASWESVCALIPCDRLEGCTSESLTVQVKQVGEVDLGTDINFSVVIFEDRKVEIVSHCNHPWNIRESSRTDDGEELVDCPEPDTTNQPDESLKAVWNRLQDLQFEARELRELIYQEECRLREMLRRGCPNSATNRGDCTTLACRLRHSFSLILDFIRQMRYRFGPLPYSSPGSLCAQNPHVESYSPQYRHSFNTTSLHHHLNPASSHFPIDLLTLIAAGILLATIAILTFLICRNSVFCLRRRADRAARREERQARRAYKSAARRLRWKRWWESWGFSSGPAPSTNYTHLHDLSSRAADNMYGDVLHLHPGNRSEGPHTASETGAIRDIMDSEIWNFRQALEYVSGLVQIPNRDRGLDLESGQLHPHAGDADAGADVDYDKRRHSSKSGGRSRAASSTAGLSTVMSLRTTTMSVDSDIETDTPSFVTLDTLHTETPPPSYHP